MTAAGLAAASCAQPTPEVVEKEVPVEKVVKETVVVEKEVAVEKVVTATAVASNFNEAPMLAGRVQQGELPPVDERLPENPCVLTPHEMVGQYGGTWHRLAVSAGDIQTPARLMYDNLVRFNIDGSEIIPNVASSWEISPDGTEFTFMLRPGMKWSDGAPYTSADLAWLVEDHWGNEEITSAFPTSWSPGGTPMTVETPDDYTITYKFGAPFGLMMVKQASANGLAFTLYPSHHLKQYHVGYTDREKLQEMAEEEGFEFWYQLYSDKGGNVWNADKRGNNAPQIHAWITTVPAPKIPVVMERNPYYYKVDTDGNQLPYIDRIEHVIVQNSDQINLRAASGEVDMQLRHVRFDNYPIFKDSEEVGDYSTYLWKQGFISDAILAFNLTVQDPVLNEIFNDVRFRQACSLGINRSEIIESVYLGMAEPTQVTPLPSSPHYWEELATHLIEYDPDRANSLLDEVGLTERDGEGYRLRPDGDRLVVVYEYAPVFGAWGDIGELLTAQWEALGIEVVVKEEARQLLTERLEANEHDLTVWTGSAEFNPLIDPRWFLPNPGALSSPYGFQYGQWWATDGAEGVEPTGDMRRVLELYDEISVTVDTEEQQRLFRQILELDKKNLWAIGIATAPPQPVIVKNDFHNVPEEGVSDWHLLTPGSTAPEQYFIQS
jgi:peptide/nickel transport system substrate-binding protein